MTGEEPRAYTPPDHSGPGVPLDPRAPYEEGDRVAWVRRELVPRGGRRKAVARDVERRGRVAEVVDADWLYVLLDEPAVPDDPLRSTRVLLPRREVHPRADS